MKQLLSKYLGKTIEINLGGAATIRGQIEDIIEGTLKLRDEDETVFFIPIDKIHVFWESNEREKTVGFTTKPMNQDPVQ